MVVVERCCREVCTAGAVQLTMNGGLGNDVFLGSEGDDLINGGDGNDVALMGFGDDTFVWNPGDDNDTIEGQAGFDTMDFNGANVAETVTLSANGGRALFFRDIANVTMDLNDTEADVSAEDVVDELVLVDAGEPFETLRDDLGAEVVAPARQILNEDLGAGNGLFYAGLELFGRRHFDRRC